MTTYVLVGYLAQFFIEFETFQAEVVEEIKTHNSCSPTLLAASVV